MDNSFGARPPWPNQPNQHYQQGYNPSIPNGIDPRLLVDPSMQPRLPAMNGYQNVRPGLATPSSVGGGYPMWDMDVPSQMFMQAMNFERMMGSQVPQQNVRDISGMESSTRPVPNKTLDDSTQRSEAGLDLIEQQQAMEQARLLQRFKELRQWQQQQQEVLMSKQQQQLSMFRKEQDRVQTIISKQRDQQWGGGHANNFGGMSTPPRRQLPPGVDVSQLMASGLFSHTGPSQQQLSQSRGALPKPVIYVEPEDEVNDDDEIKTNPDLFSDTNSNRGSQATVEEGMFPIPDSASEASVDVVGQYHQQRMPAQHYQQRFNPHELDAPKKLHRSFAELDADEDFINQSYQSPTLLSMHHQQSQQQEKRSGNQRENELLDKVEESDEDESESDDSEEEEEDSEDEEESEEEEQEDTQIEVEPDSKSLDEIPVKPGIVGSKTFEQLLEEQMQAEEERLKQANMNQDSPSQPKRTFLKKGEGIARFEAKPGQKPTKSKKAQKVNNSSKSNTMQKTASSQKHSTGNWVTQKSNKDMGKMTNKPPTKSQKSSGSTGVKSSNQTAQKKNQKTDIKGKKTATRSPVRDGKKAASKSPKGENKKTSAASATGEIIGAAANKAKKAESIPDDASFIASIKERQKESEQDMEELDEFEILEHFADNMSFCSNSSIVTKGLRGLQSDRILTGVLPKSNEVGRPVSPRAALIKKLETEKQAKVKQPALNRQTVHNKQGTEAEVIHRKVAHPQKTAVENQIGQNKQTDDDNDEYESVSDSSDESSDESSDDSSDDGDDKEDNEKVTHSFGTGDGAQFLNSGTHNHKILVAKGFGDMLKTQEDDGTWKNKNDSVLSTDKKLERVLSYTGFTETSISQASDSDQNLDSDDGDEVSTGYDAVEDETSLKVLTRKVAGRESTVPNLQKSGAENFDFLTSSFNASAYAPHAKSPIVISKEKVPVSKQDLGKNQHLKDADDVKFSYHSDTDSVGRRQSYSDDDKSESGETEHKSDSKRVSEKKTLQFDDDEEWGETTPVTVKKYNSRQKHDSEGDSEHNRTLIDEDDNTRSVSDQMPLTDHSNGTPPTSKLVSKLFPKLKPQQKKQEEQDLQKIQAVSQSNTEDGIQSKILRDKLRELDKEIEKFRHENSKLTKLRAEREEGISTLKKEIAEFEKEKFEELRRLEEFKSEEMKKLKHERKMFDKYQKAARAGPDKKEREEIETLKSQLTDVQEEMKRKESRWTSNNGRLRTKIDQLEQENEELKEEIKMLEKKRLEWLQKDQSKNKGKASSSQVPLRSSTPTEEDDMFDADQQLSNGYGYHAHEQQNDLSSTSSIRSNTNLKPSHNPTKVNVHSSFPPSHKNHTNQPHPSQNKVSNVNQSSKTSLPQASTKGNQSKKTGAQTSKPSHLMQGQSHNKAASKAGGKTNANTGRAGNHSDKNVLRTSLTEDLPRRVLTSMAAPQDISMYSETDGDVSTYAPTNLPRKFAPRMDKSIIDKGDNSYDETQHSDGKIERSYNNGAREILFSNGTRKEISSDGKSIVVSFFNGDCKQIMPDQRVVYYYADAQTTHTSYPDGLEILQFPNQQTEKLYPDGTKEIAFPDQTVKYIFPNGSEESIFPDGTVIRLEKNGDKTMEFPNGQREIHTQEYKKREYPDGTVKTVYPDGRQETRYSNGRLRVKDKDGNVIVDRLC